tara:strand:- start:154 stop:1158 length:1005 start_codon:yes stop_codon:yes gene_type:complete
MGLTNGGSKKKLGDHWLQRAYDNEEFVQRLAEELEPGIDEDEWLGSWRTDVAPASEAWLKIVSARIKAGYLVDDATLRRLKAVVKPQRPPVAPSADHRLEIAVEMCIAERPGPNLIGTHERYVSARDDLRARFDALYADEGEWERKCAFRTNPPATSMPRDVFLPPSEALHFVGRFSPTVQAGVQRGTRVVNASCFPPVLHRYPRIGALEVTALVYRDGEVVAHECVFSKLLSGRWPGAARVMARIDGFVQDALWREQQAQLQAWAELVFSVEDGYMLHDAQMAQLRQAVTQNPGQVLELVEDGYALSGESLALLRERAAEAASGRGPLTEVGD